MWLAAQSALACGGFFCNQIDPIEQSAERVLFREDGPQDWTTIVEVQFQGPPGDFGWVIPIPRALDPETEIALAPAGLFDALEGVTGPRFVSAASTPGAYAEMSAGCESGCGGFTDVGFVAFDTSGVAVVGQAVVGPYDLEVITAGSGDNLVNWLQLAGYQIPFTAFPIIDLYLQEGYAFLGVKLLPDVPQGPVDALVLRCGAAAPTIPLRLTSIAAVPDMEVLAYVLAAEPYAPAPDWPRVDIDPSQIVQDSTGATNYAQVLEEAADAAGGRAFRVEYAQPASAFVPSLPDEVQQALGHGAWLTRMRTYLSAQEMQSDPVFVPDPEGQPVAPEIWLDGSTAASLGLGWALLLAGVGLRRRAIRPPSPPSRPPGSLGPPG